MIQFSMSCSEFPNFFEHLAIRERLEGVDVEVISLTLGSSVLRYWSLWEPVVRQLRASQPTAWVDFERLAHRIREIEAATAARGLTGPVTTSEPDAAT